MDTDNGNVGDEFMRQLEPIAAYVPYMTAVGNHEVILLRKNEQHSVSEIR